jgi:mannitol-1-/sugar-/sorbitol-6-phosphatase
VNLGEARDAAPAWTRDVAAVLFDCDGVLVDSDASVLSAWTRWAQHYGLDPDAVHPQVHGRRSADTVRALLSPDLVAEATERIDRYELADAATVRAVPGAPELAAALPPDRWAVVTSGTRALATARLAAAGIVAPPILLTADDLHQGKPAPEGYLRAAVELGRDPSRCAVLEDAGSGVDAARAAGVRVVVGIGPRALSTDADAVVVDLSPLTYDARVGRLTIAGSRLR